MAATGTTFTRRWRIGTLEGGHEVSKGDFIIKGVKGEFYPCKPDIFAMTYEPAASPEAPTPPAPAVPHGWLRAIDEALVCSHLDVADASDNYEAAKAKLNKLLCHEQGIGAYFAVPPGWRMVPVEPTDAMVLAGINALYAASGEFEPAPSEIDALFEAMLAAAPEAPTPPAPEALVDACAKLLQEALPHAEWQDKHIHPVGRETYQNWKVTVYLPVPLSEADKSPQAALTRAVKAEVRKRLGV